MKATLEFDLDTSEGRRELALATNARYLTSLLYHIEQDVFRPARKHGYPIGSDPESMIIHKQLNAWLESEDKAEIVSEVIHMIETLYYKQKNEMMEEMQEDIFE